MTTFFSIIIPLFNCGATLIDTLQSVVQQDFSNYELILIDGGSTDNTMQIVNDHINQYPSKLTRFVSEPDNGIYDAMNKGIKMAKGDWLYFMGGDDSIYSFNVLSRVFDAINQFDPDLIYGNVLGAVSKTKYADKTIQQVLSRGIHHQGIFYKRHLFDYTGPYSLDFKVAADYHLTLKAFCNNSFKTQYVAIDIAGFGEEGLSASVYDYKFFSYHYKFLATNGAIKELIDPLKRLETSLYCCLYLAKQKEDMRFAWANAYYYITKNSFLNPTARLRFLLRMIYWSIKPTN